jgi:hypothetical protein
MKKSFAAALIVTFFLMQSYAQVSFGVKAGLNISNVKDFSSVSKTRLGVHGGLLTEVGINKNFILQPELLYSVKGFKSPRTQLSGEAIVSLNYISVPLLGGFRANKNIVILLGSEFNFLTKANSRFDGIDHDLSKVYRKFDMAIDLGVAYHIQKDFGVELRYSYGLKDLADVHVSDLFGNDLAIYRLGSNRVFQLGLFYKVSKK